MTDTEIRLKLLQHGFWSIMLYTAGLAILLLVVASQ